MMAFLASVCSDSDRHCKGVQNNLKFLPQLRLNAGGASRSSCLSTRVEQELERVCCLIGSPARRRASQSWRS